MLSCHEDEPAPAPSAEDSTYGYRLTGGSSIICLLVLALVLHGDAQLDSLPDGQLLD
jgi:hypothetical protein